MKHLPLTATLQEYEAQADLLLRGHAEGDPDALRIIHHHHPRFLNTEIRWLPLPLSGEDIRTSPFDSSDARLALARWYCFVNWNALTDLVAAVESRTPGICEFETAVEAVVAGDLAALKSLLARHPDLVTARSSRVTPFDPPVHRATLLHYIAANGVEGYRQRTPSNAVEIARALLDAGADPNAVADMYGGKWATLPLLVSSGPPAEAGVQIALAETLLDYGAAPDRALITALTFGFTEAAEALARRGVPIVSLAVAAGLGRAGHVTEMLAAADSDERHRALALAAQLGHVEVVRLLLDADQSPDRFNPEGMHSHATPLHHAAVNGHEAVVRLLLERGARRDIKDKIWNSTPRGWAEYGGYPDIAALL